MVKNLQSAERLTHPLLFPEKYEGWVPGGSCFLVTVNWTCLLTHADVTFDLSPSEIFDPELFVGKLDGWI